MLTQAHCNLLPGDVWYSRTPGGKHLGVRSRKIQKYKNLDTYIYGGSETELLTLHSHYCVVNHLAFPKTFIKVSFQISLSMHDFCHLSALLYEKRIVLYLSLTLDFRVAFIQLTFPSIYPPSHDIHRTDHNTGNSMSCSLRIVCGLFYVPQGFEL